MHSTHHVFADVFFHVAVKFVRDPTWSPLAIGQMSHFDSVKNVIDIDITFLVDIFTRVLLEGIPELGTLFSRFIPLKKDKYQGPFRRHLLLLLLLLSNQKRSTEVLGHSLVRSLAPDCSLRSRPPLRSLARSLTSLTPELMGK